MADRTVVGGGGDFTYDWARKNPITCGRGAVAGADSRRGLAGRAVPKPNHVAKL